MNKTRAQKEAQQHAIDELREILPPGSNVHMVVKHVSRSGLMRVIDVLTVDDDGGIYSISPLVARALGWRWDSRHGGVRVDGCGMDMGFHLAHHLSYALHGAESVGPDAIAASGRPFRPTREQVQAGYSLIHRWV